MHKGNIMENESEGKYIYNNWLKNENHKILKEFQNKNGVIYMSINGEITYSINGEWNTTKDYKALSNLFSNLLGEDINFSSFSKTKSKDSNASSKINPDDLIIVTGEIFNIHSNKEFIKLGNNTYLRNIYKPSYYMQLDFNKRIHNFDVNNSLIIKLINHLTNYDNQRTIWVINWLAHFFQKLKKSQVSLVLIGPQGAGKGIFFNDVIKPIIGEQYTKIINDKSLNSNYLGGLIENILFYNLDEISVKKSTNGSIKNFLKALVTNDSITSEKKFVTINKETVLFGQVLITSNENFPVEIEEGDRRFTVFTTSCSLKQTNYLGFGNYDVLSNNIKNELEVFISFLKTFNVDIQKANTALYTIEKDLIITESKRKQITKENTNLFKFPKMNKLQKNIKDFIFNIQTRNQLYFANLAYENNNLYMEIITDMNLGFFRLTNLVPAFKELYGSNIKTSSELLVELQKDFSRQFYLENLYDYNCQGELIKVFKITPINYNYNIVY